MMQPRGDRSGAVLEPMLTDQWFVAMSQPAPADTLHPGKSITEVALEVVAKGDVQFFPSNWTTTYNQWLENIQDWCISRQLWWGHQIPAWYAEDGQVFVARTEAEPTDARPRCARHLVFVCARSLHDDGLAATNRRLRPLFAFKRVGYWF